MMKTKVRSYIPEEKHKLPDPDKTPFLIPYIQKEIIAGFLETYISA